VNAVRIAVSAAGLSGEGSATASGMAAKCMRALQELLISKFELTLGPQHNGN
jgi:hypothetical protein